MAGLQGDIFQVIETVDEIFGGREELAISEPLFPEGAQEDKCVICGARFVASRAQANVCSPACRRERKLRYGAAYRQLGRAGKQLLHDLFGGRRPTEEDILRLIQRRKGRP